MYQIAIPSLSRVNILKEQTLKTLDHHHISKSQITIFCIANEYEQYKTITDYNIVVGHLGLIKQKQFIESYYPVDTNILYLDDDIQQIDVDTYSSLDEFIQLAFNECRKQKSYIWSIYPVWNKFFRQNKILLLSKSLKLCIGSFTGIINRKNNPIIKCSDREDVERTIKYFMRDGIVLRFNNVGYKTKFFNNGGLGLLKDRLQTIEKEVNYLSQTYSVFGSIRQKKYIDFKLKKIQAFEPIQIPIDPSELFELYSMLEDITIPIKNQTNGRRGFPNHRAITFGLTKGRFSGKTDLSYYTKMYPQIYNEIVRIGNLFSFEFTSIHLNHNVTCPKHKDENNQGNSLLLSFGNYTGGNIMIEEKKYDANCNGIIFNGSLLEHWNTNDLVGNKYSLVFFN